MDFFLSPPVAVFSGVLLCVALLCLFEFAATLVAGVGFTHLLDTLIDTDSLPDSTLTNWLLIKDVPLLMAITALLSGFGITGLALQGFAASVAGAALPLLAAVPIALGGALGSLRMLAGAFKKFKVVHTTALSASEFIGQTVMLLSPTATANFLGEAKFIDRHGQTHYLMVKPAGDEVFKQGDAVELIEPTGGGYLARRIS
jgi:hypothetical protein